ncbi:butyrophilin subfamily 1 member A1-like [Alosa sapidissima]|uniref:butyrophilin subfamily 1 member A1-like n=1 Tax=Alosa sapidissima TaxID=34773 RepID=UPI001C09D528|nr:butyrophilin subfamily 1 member A1-like [Alosa sapidissima]
MVGCILRDMLLPRLCLMLVVLHAEETVASVSFSILVPGEKILASPGDTITLPCSVSPTFHPSEVRWYRPDKYNTPILLYKKLQVEEQEAADTQYTGRASLIGALEEGNASLKLDNLSASDSGEYVCYIQHDSWYERGRVLTEVRVLGSVPLISITDRGNGQVNVTCVSEGWSPQPTFTWRNRKGIEIKKGLNEVHSKDDQGLTTVSSWMLVSPSDSDGLFCSVGLPDQEMMESRVALHLSREQTCTPTGAWKDVVIAILALCLLGVGIYHLHKKGFIKWLLSQKNRNRKEATDEEIVKFGQEEQMEHRANSNSCTEPTNSKELSEGTTEEIHSEKPPEKPKGEDKETNTEVDVSQTPEWDEAKQHKVLKLIVDEKTVPPSLTVKGKGATVYCPQPEKIHGHDNYFPHVLCTGPLSSGQYYWEVEMKKPDKQSWYVGVCSTTAAKLTPRVPITPENGFWVLHYEKGTGLFANTKPPLLVPTVKQLCKLGVYLNSSKKGIHTMSFFNAENGWPLCSFKYFKESGGLTPVLSPGLRDKYPLTVC